MKEKPEKRKRKARVHRGPVAEIDLAALQHNLQIMRSMAGKRDVIGVVKADAYGHGSVEVARRLVAAGAAGLAVAYTDEAKLLREGGITVPILVFVDQENPDDYFRYDLVPVLRDRRTVQVFSDEARKRGMRTPVHMKIDTGMGRIGFRPEQTVEAALEIAGMEGLRLEGLMSHFSEADLGDGTYARQQLRIFSDLRDAIQLRTGLRLRCHIANSAAVLSLPDALFDAVRPGIALYGCSPFVESFGLRPVLSLRSEVLAVRNLPAATAVSYGRTFVTKRDSRIAVIPVGYADGYNRLFSNNAEMLLKGCRVPVVGRVCMDMTMLDVTDVPNVSEGDEVMILGRQGEELITAAELAGRINTIPYEILTSLGTPARKAYFN
ncbi:MAG: alanine racemase [Nitrospirae bacterium]|nr:alanine racemase [Nitrospirota bacterium]